MTKNKDIIKILNKLYNYELKAHNKYMSYASSLDAIGIRNIADFLKDLAIDKINNHLTRIYEYMTHFGESIKIDENSNSEISDVQIFQENTNRDLVLELLNRTLNSELSIRELIAEIALISFSGKDFETFEFIQWFVKDYIHDIREIEELIYRINDEDTSIFDIKIKKII